MADDFTCELPQYGQDSSKHVFSKARKHPAGCLVLVFTSIEEHRFHIAIHASKL